MAKRQQLHIARYDFYSFHYRIGLYSLCFNHRYVTYSVGTAYLYYHRAENAKRKVLINDEARSYWMHTPGSDYSDDMRLVRYDGEFGSDLANHGNIGVRPALNLKSDTLVSEIRN